MVGLSLCSCHSLSPNLPNKHPFSFFLVKLKCHLLCESRPPSGPSKAGLPALDPEPLRGQSTITLQGFAPSHPPPPHCELPGKGL